MFVTFLMAPNRNKQDVFQWVTKANKHWHAHTMEHFTTVKKELSINTSNNRMHVQRGVLSEKSQSQDGTYYKMLFIKCS